MKLFFILLLFISLIVPFNVIEIRATTGQKVISTKIYGIPCKSSLPVVPEGDVALFFHHPVSTSSHTYLGGSLACEAKSTESNVGGRAVGQARNLRMKIQERFSDYLVQPIVVSRSNVGYDPSGRNLAPPEVIHITANGIIKMLMLQKKRLDRGESLILPTHIFQILDNFVKNEIIEPKPDELADCLENVIKVSNWKVS